MPTHITLQAHDEIQAILNREKERKRAIASKAGKARWAHKSSAQRKAEMINVRKYKTHAC